MVAPDGDGGEEHHGGHIVQESREDGGDEAQDDDHGPHSAFGKAVGLLGRKQARKARER